jgi:hypothetical protein
MTLSGSSQNIAMPFWRAGMITSTAEVLGVAVDVQISDEDVVVQLADGRTISVPIAWYPRLFHSTVRERNRWELIGDGEGIHWPDLDEDISVAGMLLGKPSGESQRSFKHWLDERTKARKRKRTRSRA